MVEASFPCPCGRTGPRARPLAYAQCCGRYIDDFERTPASDAEALMRSRYTAFMRERADYLLATWHASTRPATLVLDPAQRWLGLQVKAHLPVDATHAEVVFVARSRDASGRVARLAEHSRFVREAGAPDGLARWYYVDGTVR